METKKYKKKPVEVDAIQFTGTEDNCWEVHKFITVSHKWKPSASDGGFIETLEGDMEFSSGDYIIKGVKGEFYPCKPDIFRMTYDPL